MSRDCHRLIPRRDKRRDRHLLSQALVKGFEKLVSVNLPSYADRGRNRFPQMLPALDQNFGGVSARSRNFTTAVVLVRSA